MLCGVWVAHGEWPRVQGVRRCEEVLARGPASGADSAHASCEDLLRSGGITGQDGSCCKADGALADGWCLKVHRRLTP